MIDTHCHLIDPQFNRDIEKVIERAKSSGISFIINIGYDVNTSISAVKMHKNYEWLLPAIGIHPNESAEESLRQIVSIEKLCENQNIIAIGETGLDYYRNYTPRDAQQTLFRQHIHIAREYSLPLIIHTRNSVDDTVKILKEENYHRGVFHCYSGTYEQAKKILDMGFYLGFGGVLTFSKNARELFQHIPIEFVVFETDAPFLAPASHRGHRNEPLFIFETLHSAASIKGLSLEKMEEVTDKNASRLFSLKI